jgi:hypothetical protein
VALVKPLHSGDPDVMHFSRSLLRFERLAPFRAIRTSTRPIKYIRVRVKLSHDQMALCIECSAAVQEVLGSIPDCDALKGV